MIYTAALLGAPASGRSDIVRRLAARGIEVCAHPDSAQVVLIALSQTPSDGQAALDWAAATIQSALNAADGRPVVTLAAGLLNAASDEQFDSLAQRLRDAAAGTRSKATNNERATSAERRVRELERDHIDLAHARSREARNYRRTSRERSTRVDRIRSDFDNLLASWRWKIGDRIVRIAERLLFRSPVKLAAEQIEENLSTLAERCSEEAREAVERGAATPLDPWIYPASRTVDVIVCVHNALNDVRRCLASVVRNRSIAFRLILVDDGSDSATQQYLEQFAHERRDDVTLIRRPRATGYTRAANAGLRASRADYVILLNSDTVVPASWIELIVRAGEERPDAGLLGPLSNAATWQSVPERFDEDGSWAINALPPGFDVDRMATTLRRAAGRRYPSVPLLNGFCLALKRAVIERVGTFDEDAFPHGYGEENDYCIRAAAAGFDLVVVDDLYVFHAKSKSYGHSERAELSKVGGDALHKLHGKNKVREMTRALRKQPELAGLRRRLRGRLRDEASTSDGAALSLLFLLPVRGGGGGAHSVVQEAVGMRRLGVNASIAIRAQHTELYRANYPEYDDIPGLLRSFSSENELVAMASEFDTVVATIFTSVALLERIRAQNSEVLPVYYVQDYEPYFVDPASELHAEAFRSYAALPDMLRIAKTQWLCEVVEREHAVPVTKVSPSLDHAVYFAQWPTPEHDTVRICAMIRPRTPRRGPERSLRVLSKLWKRYGSRIEITLFGCSGTELEAMETELDFEFDNRGVLRRDEVASVLRSHDLFFDLSDYQAFGRTGLEAMACGCVPILPIRGGAHEYAVDGSNASLVDTRSDDACATAAAGLVDDPPIIAQMRERAIETASRYSIRRAATSELLPIIAALRARRNSAIRPR